MKKETKTKKAATSKKAAANKETKGTSKPEKKTAAPSKEEISCQAEDKIEAALADCQTNEEILTALAEGTHGRGRPKGQPKTGGRKAGTPNKVTGVTKEYISQFLADYQNSTLLIRDFARLDPKERLDVYVKLTAFILPKPQAVDLNMKDVPPTIEKTLLALSGEAGIDETD